MPQPGRSAKKECGVQALFSSSATKIAAVEFQHSHLKYLLIEISADASTAASAIRAVRPDFLKLKAAGSDDIVGIIITVCDGEHLLIPSRLSPMTSPHVEALLLGSCWQQNALQGLVQRFAHMNTIACGASTVFPVNSLLIISLMHVLCMPL